MRRLLERWWVLLLVLLAVGLPRVRLDTEVLNLLPDAVQEVHGLKLLQKHFTNSRELLITVRGPEAGATETAARLLAAGLRNETNLTASVTWQPPWTDHPEQMAELVACMWLNQPPEAFSALTNRLAPDHLNAVLEDTREQLTTSMSPMALGRLGYDPFGLTQLLEPGQSGGGAMDPSQDWFTSADGKLRVVYVEAPARVDQYRATAQWLEQVRAAAARCAREPEWPAGAVVRYTGAPAFATEIATGMERDMKGSAISTLLLVAGLFWWAHRSWRPLLWLGALLTLIVLGTLAAGGLIWGKVNAVSLGFAAILLGLGVDYALVLYQEAIATPQLSAREIQRLLAPGIFWSSVTTACAFGLLVWAGMPGLAQLGSLVAVGILLAAGIMIYGFLPVALKGGVQSPGAARTRVRLLLSPTATRAVTAALFLAAVTLLLWKGTRLDQSTSPLQPKHCEAQAAFDELDQEMNRQGTPALLVVAGDNEQEVAHRLDRLESRLQQAKAEQRLQSFLLPTGLWPHPERAKTNLQTALACATHLDAMRAAVRQAGFKDEAMALTETVLGYWAARSGSAGAIWPTNASSRWILRRAAAWTGEQWLATGMAVGESDPTGPQGLKRLHETEPKVWVTAWPMLAKALLDHVESRWLWLVAATAVLITACLWLGFRRWSEVALSWATLAFSLLVLLSFMAVMDWSWNLMSLTAVPLLLGAGVDYTIHVQLALRRHAGDVGEVRRVTGRAVFLCAATTVAGFGSNAFSSNAGLAALGSVCAVGMGIVYLSAVYLLPGWWLTVHRNEFASAPGAGPAAANAPSTMYRAWVWTWGQALVRALPAAVCSWAGRLAAGAYGRLHPRRRAVVEQNLLPVFAGDQAAARRATQRLYRNFGGKVAQLLRAECVGIGNMALGEWSGLERLTAAQARGRGVLLVTPHLGDWELGGYLMARHGFRLLVLTQPEPGPGFTERRMQSRARWGIETLVVGQDMFAFVEIIKRLQEGAVVALLVDRPPAGTGVSVELFGRPFQASVGAAELARASGCAVLPVYVVHQNHGTAAHILPEIGYDRQALGEREARREMTQRMLRAFEPVIRQHADQWYHFVPMWPSSHS
jgi:predicted exporter/lauroyl/myristoyl acyltransferase